MPRPPLSRILPFLFLACLLLPLVAAAQPVPFRVMTYNGLRVSGNDGNRLDEFQIVFEASSPDIVVMQEIENEGGARIILDALNAGTEEFSMAPFINGYDTDNAFYYRSDLVTFISQDTISTALREFSEYTVRIGDHELRLYGAHLKAGSGAQNQNLRYDEAVILRDRLDELNAGTEFILLGDLNLSSSYEPAYQYLIRDQSDNDGRVRDLVESDLVGSWRNNPAFASVHSQSPRTTSFQGGATGGMDDRFDFIFSSFEMNDSTRIEFVEGSYTVFGNDGQHFNTSILDGPNEAVSPEVAQAIHDASDHLPVFADFISLSVDSLPVAPPVSDAPLVFSEIFYDTPGIDGDEEWIEIYNPTDSTVNLAGWFFTDNNGYGATFVFPDESIMQPQSYFTVANEAVDFLRFYGYDADLYASLPGLNNSGDAVLLFSPDSVLIDQVAWEGGASRGLPTGWGNATEPRALRGESIERSDVSVDTDSFTDWVVIRGNGNPQTQAPIITEFNPFTVSTEVDPGFGLTRLSQNYPNPTHGPTSIEYALARAGEVSVILYDMLGREVELLVDTYQEAGAYAVSADFSYLPNGVYVYRMQTKDFSKTHQLVVAR